MLHDNDWVFAFEMWPVGGLKFLFYKSAGKAYLLPLRQGHFIAALTKLKLGILIRIAWVFNASWCWLMERMFCYFVEKYVALTHPQESPSPSSLALNRHIQQNRNRNSCHRIW